MINLIFNKVPENKMNHVFSQKDKLSIPTVFSINKHKKAKSYEPKLLNGEIFFFPTKYIIQKISPVQAEISQLGGLVTL